LKRFRRAGEAVSDRADMPIVSLGDKSQLCVRVERLTSAKPSGRTRVLHHRVRGSQILGPCWNADVPGRNWTEAQALTGILIPRDEDSARML
jgi:hypothetical protein